MSKIWLVTQREFITRIKKPSFIIMSILGPILIAGFFAAMFYMASSEDTNIKKIAVIDETSEFLNKLTPTKYLKFVYCPVSELNNLKKTLKKTDYYGILYISPIIANSPGGVQFYSFQQPSLNVTQYISSAIEKELRDQKLMAYKIQNIDAILKSVETRVSIETVKLSESGEEKKSSTGVAMGLAYVGSLLIYMFILMFGVQVMRGVIEEKTNRIVEVIISSVKPFQLMMGKIVGVALVGLTQFLLWIILSWVVVTFVAANFIGKETTADKIVGIWKGTSLCQVKPSACFGPSFTRNISASIPRKRGGLSTACTATTSRRFCGERCGRVFPQAACKAWRCG